MEAPGDMSSAGGSVGRVRLLQARATTVASMGMIGIGSIAAVALAGKSLWPGPAPVSPTGATGSNVFGMSTNDFVMVMLCLAVTVNGCLVGVLLPHFLLAGESHRAARARGERPTGRERTPVGVPAKVFAVAATIRAGAFGFVGMFGVILVLMLGTVLPGLAAACLALVLLAMTFPTPERFRVAVGHAGGAGEEGRGDVGVGS
ncbi:MAG: hypothetical protein ACTS3F_07635 [Phycisphaerales bacterium]